MIIVLGNGQEIRIKKLGARSQAQALDILCEIAENESIQALLGEIQSLSTGGQILVGADLARSISRAIRFISAERFDHVVNLVCLVSTLDRESIDVDGEDSVTIDDLVSILIEAAKMNGLSSLMDRLGNVQQPSEDQPEGIGEAACTIA